MAYEMVMPYHLHMPSYFLETFTEYPYFKEKFREIIKKKDSMITFTIEADYVKDHFQKDLYHSCFHTVYIEIPPGWNGHFTQVRA